MIVSGFVRRMALYNRGQNRNLPSATEAVGHEARQAGGRAFIGSISASFPHLPWAEVNLALQARRAAAGRPCRFGWPRRGMARGQSGITDPACLPEELA